MKKIIWIIPTIVLVAIFSVSIYAGSMQVTQGETVEVSEETCCVRENEYLRVDTDASDGHIVYLYGAWALLDPSKNIIAEQSPVQIFRTYNAIRDCNTGNTTFVAEEIGDYVFAVSIFYVEQDYNVTSGMWETIDSGICGNSREIVEVNYPQPVLNNIVTTVNQLFQDWLIWLQS